MRQGKARLRLEGVDPINQGLMAFWPQSEKAGSVLRDITPLRANAIIAAGITRCFGLIGRCASYSTGNAQVTRPYVFSGRFSIHAWINTATGSGTNNYIITSLPSTNSTRGFSMQTDNGTTLSLSVDTPSGSTTVASSAFSDIRGRWVSVGASFGESNAVVLYLNGVVVGTGSTSSGPLTTLTGFSIGRNAVASRHFSGKMGPLRVWNRTLTPKEFRRLAVDPWVGTRRTRMVAANSNAPGFSPIVMGLF